MYIYVATSKYLITKNIIKIGMTEKPHIRIRSFMTSCPPGLDEIEYVLLLETDAKSRDELYKYEYEIHNKYAEYRMVRNIEGDTEWFNFKDIDPIKSIKDFITKKQWVLGEVDINNFIHKKQRSLVPNIENKPKKISSNIPSSVPNIENKPEKISSNIPSFFTVTDLTIHEIENEEYDILRFKKYMFLQEGMFNFDIKHSEKDVDLVWLCYTYENLKYNKLHNIKLERNCQYIAFNSKLQNKAITQVPLINKIKDILNIRDTQLEGAIIDRKDLLTMYGEYLSNKKDYDSLFKLRFDTRNTTCVLGEDMDNVINNKIKFIVGVLNQIFHKIGYTEIVACKRKQRRVEGKCIDISDYQIVLNTKLLSIPKRKAGETKNISTDTFWGQYIAMGYTPEIRNPSQWLIY